MAAWLVARGLYPPPGNRWHVKVMLDLSSHPIAATHTRSIDTRFEITIEPDAWGYRFSHADRISTIHVTDTPTARDNDDHHLALATPPLKNLSKLLRSLEERFHVFFPRHHATVNTDISGGDPIIRAWVASL